MQRLPSQEPLPRFAAFSRVDGRGTLNEREPLLLGGTLAEVHVDDVLVGYTRPARLFLEVVDSLDVDVHGHRLAKTLGVGVRAYSALVFIDHRILSLSRLAFPHVEPIHSG